MGHLGPADLDGLAALDFSEHAEVARLLGDAELPGEPAVGPEPSPGALLPGVMELPVDVEGLVRFIP